MPAGNGQPDNLATAVAEVSERMAVLIREEVELAKVEVTQKATSLGRGAAAVAAGAVFGVFAVIFILETIAWGLNAAFNSVWIGFAIVMVVLILLTAASFLIARRLLKVGAPTPVMAIDEAKKIRETVSATGPEA